MAAHTRTRDPVIDPADNAMLERRKVAIASAAISATGTTDQFYLGDCGTFRCTLTCTAVSGTSPTLDTVVQTSADGSTWYSAGAFTQVTGAGAERKCFAVDRWVRFSHTIGGSSTPTVTASIDGEAV
jgi:hypothetical protein